MDSLAFAEDCAAECDSYISILDIDSHIPIEARECIEGLVRNFNATATFPILLSGLACLSESDFRKLAEAVVALVVRYSVLANLNPSLLESALYEAARGIRGKHSTGERSSRCLGAAKGILSKMNPSDATVIESGKDVDLTRQQASWLIKNLAKHMQSRTREIGFEKTNLEHVFPENAGPE